MCPAFFVDARHGTPILRTHLDGIRIGDNALTAVSRDLIVDADLERLEERRFAVEAASND